MNNPVIPAACERWGVYEVCVPGRSDGNPFTDFTIRGEFRGPGETKTVSGFYDGEGVYKVRFMPAFEGNYTFTVSGTFSDRTYSGFFEALPPSPGNHGPVRVAQDVHFDYEDGTPHYSIGTTCYVWHLQSPELQAQTLDTLAQGPFNKIRFCVFPKHYDYNLEDPVCFPFEGTPCDISAMTRQNFLDYGAFFPGRSTGVPKDNRWDFSRFVPEYFRHLDETVARLAELGIEADLILFHPYDRWGFSCMTREQDERYLRYVIARLAAYRNVWWSMANEYDLLPTKTIEDWDHLGTLTRELDPYGHLCSIHNCMQLYDFSKDWITHCSIQRVSLYVCAEQTDEWRERYHKPVVLDEIAYEGNIEFAWGNIRGEELVRRFWEATVRGGYAGHGETILDHIPTDSPEDRRLKLWWSHGGTLKGESPARIAFLASILDEIPGHRRLRRFQGSWDDVAAVTEGPDPDCYLFYFGMMSPLFRGFHIDDETDFEVDLIDTWNMTVTHLGVFRGEFTVPMPGIPYMAVRLLRVNRH